MAWHPLAETNRLGSFFRGRGHSSASKADDRPRACSAPLPADLCAAVDDLYRRLDARIAALNPTCNLSGRCCRFGEYGHRLYVTSVELAYFLHRQRPGGLRPVTAEACPYQQGRVCGARAHRPMGCRIYFCDPAAQVWQNDLYEEFLGELKQIGRRFAIPYLYRDWLAALSAEAANPEPAAGRDDIAPPARRPEP